MGLDHKKFKTTQLNILSRESLQKLNKVYVVVIREKKQLQITHHGRSYFQGDVVNSPKLESDSVL